MNDTTLWFSDQSSEWHFHWKLICSKDPHTGISILESKHRHFNYLTFQYRSDTTKNSSEYLDSTKTFFKVDLTPRACTLVILNAKAPCVSMPVTLYEAVCHRWRYKDKQRAFTLTRSVKTHYLVSSTLKKDIWNTKPLRVNKMGWKCHSSGNASMFLFPVAMHWLHQNFKQLIVSPLRPLFSL